MPRTGFKTEKGVSIKILNLKSSFQPGDHILGQVQIDDSLRVGSNGGKGGGAQVKVILELCGRSKTKVIYKEAHHRILRGRAPLVRVKKVLSPEPIENHQGRQDGTTEGNSNNSNNNDSNHSETSATRMAFPFEVQLPTHIIPMPNDEQRKAGKVNSLLSGDGPGLLGSWPFAREDDLDWGRDPNYLSTEGKETAKVRLPSICYIDSKHEKGWDFKKAPAVGYIEYFLSATVSWGGGSALEKAMATHPLLVRTPPSHSEYPIEHRNLPILGMRLSWKSQNLSTFMQEEDGEQEQQQQKQSLSRSLMKRLSRPFASSPMYTVRLYVQHPRMLQLDHPEHLPLNIWMMPILDERFTTHPDKARCPPVRLVAAEITLKAHYGLRVQSLLNDPEREVDMEYSLTNGLQRFGGERGGNEEAAGAAAGTIMLPPVWAAEADEEDPTKRGPHTNSPSGTFLNMDHLVPPGEGEGKLDLGDVLGIRLADDHGVSSLGGKVEWPMKMMVTGKTYNIAVKYTLGIRLQLDCVGKEYTMNLERPVTLLEVSAVQMRAKEDELGDEGMQRNWDDLRMAADFAHDFLDNIDDAIGGFD